MSVTVIAVLNLSKLLSHNKSR